MIELYFQIHHQVPNVMSAMLFSRGRSLLKTGTRPLMSFSVASLTTRSQEPPGYRNVLKKRNIPDLRLTSFSVSAVVNKKVVQEVELTNILDKYQGLLDTLNKHQEEEGEIKEPLQRLGFVVLSENVSVQRLSLETDEIRHFSNTFQALDKRKINRAANSKDIKLPSEIRIKFFTLEEDNRILQNWSDLKTKANLSEDEARTVLDNSDLSDNDRLYKIIIGHYLSQGLDHVRLACEVFQRLRLLSLNTGDFTEEEDKIIVEFVAEQGKKWSQLARILWRQNNSIQARYKEILQHQDKTKRGKFSAEEDREILKYVLDHHPDIIEGEEEENINWAFWDDIGAKLDRRPQRVYQRWIFVIQPVLTRHIAG